MVRPVTVHDLKTWPDMFEAVSSGDKTFELRRDDRRFQVGDHLALMEWHPHLRCYTGKILLVEITFKLSHEDEPLGRDMLQPGCCVLGIRRVVEEMD